MITRVRAVDFKAFHLLDIALAPITVLIGANNSGKSSIIAAIRLLAQTVQSGDRQLPLLLDGTFGDFGTYRDMVYRNHRGRPLRLALDIAEEPDVVSIELEYKYRTVRRELVLRESSLTINSVPLITTSLSSDSARQLITRLGTHPIPPPQRSTIAGALTFNYFVPQLAYFTRGRSRQVRNPLMTVVDEDEYAALDEAIDQAVFTILEDLGQVEYVSAMRAPPERTYHQTGEARARIGANGENWAGLFVLDSARPANQRNVLPRLTAWLKAAGLASDVRANWLSDRHYEVQVQHPVSHEWENLADVGQGNSQVIPVLIGGFRLSSGATYMVEEPEIHLHPRAQAELGDFFVDLRSRGVMTVVETHSEYLILRLQQHLAAGRLAPDDIAFYYVGADEDGKRLRRLSIDAEARFAVPLDRDFFPQRLEESRRLAALRWKE